MSSIIGRSAFRATRALRDSGVNAGASSEKEAGKSALKEGAKKDPELYVLGGIMSLIFGFAGYHFARSPTSSSSESPVAKIGHSEPWKEGGATEGKYSYHPGGDPSKGRREAPSALNVVVIPNVNLPKRLHEEFNKFDIDEKDW
ncbi:hypothetical protein M501DRAFT_1003574 [Patellaria atrata CBS 101060]|uniref:Uncharacterized protein n=1 Tax=Patellaria atrata CBS 101060 TaxID=1346257 RepID=A0A9P4SC18_9PEZI|nr:hypothetical protein M501DRAFT_1003574 [Patellaria atrata CBS 101060]